MNVYIRKQPLVWRKALVTLGIIMAIIAALNVGQSFIRNFFYAIANPLSATLSETARFGLASVDSSLNFVSISQENGNLKQENEQLLSQITALQSQIRQNQELDRAAVAAKENNFKLAMAGVVGINLEQQTVTINQGSAEGLLENMPVITSEKSIVGKVSRLYSHTAIVQLISAPKNVVDVKIQQADPQNPTINGVVRGNGNSGISLDLVTSDSTLNQSDVVVTSGLEGVFPKDLLVGKILSINKNDVKAFQTAQIQPFFNVKSTDTVFVVTNYKK